MGIWEIVFLVVGVLFVILSFVIPVKKEQVTEQTRELAKEEIAALVAQEMDKIKEQVAEAVEERVEHGLDKTERSLERLSNEKIMAVSEYSDTVLQDIHKNHEEVMFLYDMLNSKHVNLKNTMSEVNKTVKEVNQTRQEAEAFYSFLQMNSEEKEETGAQVPVSPSVSPMQTAGQVNQAKPSRAVPEPEDANSPKEGKPVSGGLDFGFTEKPDDIGTNSNDRILELYRQGKSKIAIAKELGLGVGEVKLVIDLYKNLDT